MAKGLPRIPRLVYGPAGPIRVIRKFNLVADDGDVCDGMWVPDKRTIYIDRALAHETAYRIYLHELYHAYLDDSNIDLPEKLLERIVDALATADVNALWWRLHHKRTP